MVFERAARRLAVVVGLGLTLALAAACGNITTPAPSGSSSVTTSGTTAPADTGSQWASKYKPTGTPVTVTAGTPVTMTITAADSLAFTPNTLTAAKGTPVTIKLTDSSALAHNISLDAFGVDKDVDAGQTVTVTFTPDQSGTFYFYCNVAGHAAAGMVGQLTVQ